MKMQIAVVYTLLLLGLFPGFQQTKTPPKPAANPPAAQQPPKTPQTPPSAPAPSTQAPAAQPIIIPPEASKKANPVKPTEKSLVDGKARYATDCALCHGPSGDGKTDLATSMSLKLADFRDPAALASRTDGDLYYIIEKGTSSMPDEGTRAKPNDIWNLVNYVRSLAEKKTTAKSR